MLLSCPAARQRTLFRQANRPDPTDGRLSYLPRARPCGDPVGLASHLLRWPRGWRRRRRQDGSRCQTQPGWRQTWEPVRTLFTDKGSKTKIGNVSAVVDEKTGNLHAIFCKNLEQAYSISSTDGGATFENPVELPRFLKNSRIPGSSSPPATPTASSSAPTGSSSHFPQRSASFRRQKAR